jgi:hypothetical protein
VTSTQEWQRRLIALVNAQIDRRAQSSETAMRQEAGRIATGTVSSATINLSQLAQGGATANQVLAWNSGASEWQPVTNSATLPWTTAGDLLYYDGSAAQRLAIGTAGQALVVNTGATAPEWDTVLTNPMTTAEDIIVGGASGAPARLGVGSNGDVLTVTAGSVGWSASSSIYNVASSVDNYASSYPTIDDHFTTYNTSKWTALNHGSDLTVAQANHALVFTLATTTTSRLRGLYQAVPIGTWRIQCKILGDLFNTGDDNTTLWAGAAAGAINGLDYRAATSVRGVAWASGANSNNTGLISGSLQQSTQGIPHYLYLELEWDNTDLIGRASWSGIAGTFQQIFSVAPASAPTHYGIACWSTSGTTFHAFDWFRRVA